MVDTLFQKQKNRYECEQHHQKQKRTKALGWNNPSDANRLDCGSALDFGVLTRGQILEDSTVLFHKLFDSPVLKVMTVLA